MGHELAEVLLDGVTAANRQIPITSVVRRTYKKKQSSTIDSTQKNRETY